MITRTVALLLCSLSGTSALVRTPSPTATRATRLHAALGYKAQIEELRLAFADSLVRQHNGKLKADKTNAAALKAAAAREDALEVELKATQDAFATQLSKSHDAKLTLQKEHDATLKSSYAELRQAEALLAETRAAFTDYMAKKQIELTRRTVELEKRIAEGDAELDKVKGDFAELAATLNAHVEDTDELIERQGDEIRKQRKALASVAALAESAAKA